MSCPDCGSMQAVDKATAWDAACETPKAVQKDLDRLRQIEFQAGQLIQNGVVGPNTEIETVTISKAALNMLREAFGYQPA
jgi:hypothetical protein